MRRRCEEERHDTQPVVVLPVGGSVNCKFQTIAAGGQEEDDDNGERGRGEKEDRTGVGVGSIDASTIGTVETQRARVCGICDPRRVRHRSLLLSRRQGLLNRRSRR